MKKFKISQAGMKPTNVEDGEGRVRVYVYLVAEGGKQAKGNISRTLTLTGCRVSEVMDAVREALL